MELASMTSPHDFLVTGLDLISPDYAAYAEFDGHMYAGMLPSDHDNRTGMTMFWLFEPTTQEVPDTLVLWLNGGPGCSSFNCGVMMEHSPVTQPLHDAGYCCLKPTPQLSFNEHAWTRATTMLYVEHPIGTGFSYGHPYPQTEQEASSDLDAFLQNFYSVFQHHKTSRFYVFGESYAGMFVPSVTRYIHLANKRSAPERFIVPLAGGALGNGWIDPKIQGPATIDYSWWHGLIDQPTRDALHNEWDNCMAQLGSQMEVEPPPFHPFTVQDDCGIMWGILQAAGNPNAYDITTWDPNVDQITFTSEAFFNTLAVKEALHVVNIDHQWHGCQAGSGRRRNLLSMNERRLYMDSDRPLAVTPYIGELVDDGVPMLVYNGDRDMTTNMVGTELCLNAMDWKSKDDWLDAPRGLWKVDDYPAGWVKELNNLTFAVVYNSGHMVPYNRPTSAYDLLKRFLTQTSFLDEVAPQIRVERLSKKELKKVKASKVDESMMSDNIMMTNGKFASSFANLEAGTLAFVMMAMIVGFFMGMFVTRRSTTTRGYRQVPDVGH